MFNFKSDSSYRRINLFHCELDLFYFILAVSSLSLSLFLPIYIFIPVFFQYLYSLWLFILGASFLARWRTLNQTIRFSIRRYYWLKALRSEWQFCLGRGCAVFNRANHSFLQMDIVMIGLLNEDILNGSFCARLK